MAANPIPRPPLNIEIESSAHTTTVRCFGRLNSETSAALKSAVKPIIADSDTRRIVLNLSGLEYMDSSGLGTLASLYTSCVASRHCSLQVSHLSPRVRDHEAVVGFRTFWGAPVTARGRVKLATLPGTLGTGVKCVCLRICLCALRTQLC